MIKPEVLHEFSRLLSFEKDNLPQQISTIRKDIISYDNNLFKQKSDFHSTSGLSMARVDKIDFSCLFIKGSTKFLYVIYNEAHNDGFYDYINAPTFPRWSYYKLCDGCVLGIDDPMYYKYNDLKLGWYYGDNQRFYIKDSLEIVKGVLKLNNIPKENVIFFSSSGGGYAALAASIFYQNSLSISFNPQLYLANHYYASTFTKITGIDLTRYDGLNRNDIYKLLSLSKSKHIIMVNASDSEEINHHIKPLMHELKSGLRYGLNQFDNLLIWLYDAPGAPSPHISYPTRMAWCAINKVALDFLKNKNFDILYWQELALFVNEYLYELYNEKKNIYELQNHKV